MPTVTVRPGEPDEYTIPFTFGWEQRQIVGRMRRLKIDVDRDEAKAANLNAKVDRIELDGVDTVLLTDVKTGGATWTLVCYSAEWLANRAGYTPGGDLREGNDQALINDLIGEVDGWTAGTVSNFTGPLSFVFSHAQRHEALRRIEPNVPGEIRFRDFGTVDYTARLGSDKTGSVTLSASAGTIEDSITITERNRELSGTHIRVLGAHEGEAQLYVNLIPEDDTVAQSNYDNVVTYSTPRWTEEADTDWDRWSNNDITDQATLEEEAATLGDELTDVHVTAETVVPTSVGLEIGDTVRVVKDDADLDRSMRVHKKWRRAGGRNNTDSDAAVVDKVELSTRTTLQTESDADLEELRKFNTGFQGSSVVIQAGGYLQPISSTTRATIPFRYPDIDFENNVELQVKGLPYRSFVGASGHSHDVTHPAHNHQVSTTSEDNADYESVVTSASGRTFTTVTDTWTELSSFTPQVDVSELRGSLQAEWESEIVKFRYINKNTGVSYRNTGIFYPSGGEARDYTATAPKNVNGDTIAWEAQTETGSTDVVFATFYQGIGNHTHDLNDTSSTELGTTETSTSAVGFDPGVNLWDGIDQSPELTPDNVDVLVNGSEVATDIGSGQFETTVDLGGDLNRGAWNTIELDADSRGFIQATVSARAYEQIGKAP
jgi:hypothetical protein